jgi:cytochrome c peroxidase
MAGTQSIRHHNSVTFKPTPIPFAVAEAMLTVVRYQTKDSHSHPYTSKFDDWLEGMVPLTPAERRGYQLFNDPAKADCGGCHVDKSTPDALPPLFTDYKCEALGAPWNTALVANRNPKYFDLGICGPYRTDMRKQTQCCGMFPTPTLRNVATRQVFCHNGVYQTLTQLMDFYNFRDTGPQRTYLRTHDGTAAKFNDVPPQYHPNVDVTDPPFKREYDETSAMSAQDESDIIVSLNTLTDGYQLTPSPASCKGRSDDARSPRGTAWSPSASQ